MSDGWEAFVASLDPGEVERERMRVLGDLRAERPGSRADHEMRFAHGFVARDYWRRIRGEYSADELVLRRRRQEAGVDQILRRRPLVESSVEQQDIEAAIRSYSRRQAAAAAERRTAA